LKKKKIKKTLVDKNEEISRLSQLLSSGNNKENDELVKLNKLLSNEKEETLKLNQLLALEKRWSSHS